MRRSYAAALVPMLILAGCVIVVPNEGVSYGWNSGNTVQGSGTPASEIRNADGASALRIENRRRVDMEVDVHVGAGPSLQVEGDANLVPLVHTDISGSTLRVWTEDDLKTTRPLRVHITLPQLQALESTGSVRTEVNGLAGGPLRVDHTGSGRIEIRGRVDQLDVHHTGSGYLYADGLESRMAKVDMVGSGRVNIGSVRGDQLRVSSSGSGSFYARGIVRALDVSLQGSGGAQLNDLRADIADISTAGSGSVTAWVQQKVDARSHGSGSILVTGNPSVRNVSGRHTTVQ